jgi:hypothetical protein
MLQKLKQLFSKNKATSFEPIHMSNDDIDLIKKADPKIYQLDTYLISNYYNYMIVYEKTMIEYNATVFVFSTHAGSADPHKPTRLWREKFKTSEELNSILHLFFIK